MSELICDRCGERVHELQPVNVGKLVVLEACFDCCDQISGELLSRLTPTGLRRRWETVALLGRIDHVRGLLEAEQPTRTRVESAVGFLSKRR